MAENEVVPPAPEGESKQPEPRGDAALDKVIDLLGNKGEEPPPKTPAAKPDEGDQSFDELLLGTGETPPPAKSQLEALAEGADISIEDIYKTEIPMKNREPMTLGDLKDAAAKYLQQEDWESQRQDAENTLLKQQQELSQAVSLLGDKLTPELVEQARIQNETYHAEQRRLLQNVMPQLSDPEQLTQVQERVGGVLNSYGFTPTESAAIVDHRLIKMFSDFGELHARFVQAAQRMKEIRGNAAPQTRKAPDAPKKPTQTKPDRGGQTGFDKVPAVLGAMAEGMKAK